MNEHLRDLRILATTVSSVDEGLLVFDAIAEHAQTINKKNFGEAFRYMQNAAITDLVMAFGRIVSRGNREVSFLSTSKYITNDAVIDKNQIRIYLTSKSIEFDEKTMIDVFKENFAKFDIDGYEKIRRLRDKLVAHHERGVKSEDIGASFFDVRAFVEEAYQKIDVSYFAFFNVSSPHTPLSKIEGQHATRTDKSLRRIIKILTNADVAVP